MERRKKSGTVADLPDDVLVEILSRVPVKDLHRSKCVSKGWRDLIADPLHRKKLPQTLQGFFPSYLGESSNLKGGSFINLFGGSPPPFDPSTPLLKKIPGIQKIWLSGSCNGLLLFCHHDFLRDLGYIVFNPATEQWAAVPSEHTPVDEHCRSRHVLLGFHPTVSSHFQLVIFCEEEGNLCTVHSYSSATGAWRHRQVDWAEEVKKLGQLKRWVPQIRGQDSYATLFNGMLYLILSDDQIAEVDVEGNIRRIFTAPPSLGMQSDDHRPIFIGPSQGRLHCINEERWARDIPSELSSRVYTRGSNDDCDLVSIWVLEDSDTQKWVLKHSVSHMFLFGRRRLSESTFDNVVVIHPDSNLVFIFLYCKQQLISYSLDSKEVRVVGATKDAHWLAPYVPCFSDFLSVAEREEKLMGHGEASTKDVTRAGEHRSR